MGLRNSFYAAFFSWITLHSFTASANHLVQVEQTEPANQGFSAPVVILGATLIDGRLHPEGGSFWAGANILAHSVSDELNESSLLKLNWRFLR